MTAISTPRPDPPITLTPLPPVEDDERPSVWRFVPLVAAALAGLVVGLAVARPAPLPATPDFATNLQWMFDAALAHDAVDADGEPMPAAAETVTVESVDIVDPTLGPILVLVEVDGTRHTYQLVVERLGMDWRVSAAERRAGDR